MNRIFDKIVLSITPPSTTNVLWLYPIDCKHYDLRIYTIVHLDDYTAIKKWTSIGVTNIDKTDLTTDPWYVGIPYIYSSELPVYNEYENDLNIIDIDTDILLLIMSEYIPGQTTKYQFDTKNIYFDTRCLEPIDGHAEYIIVIPKHYKISSIYKENYYEETKSYKEDVLVEGNYKIEKDVEYNGNTYTVITLQFKDVYTPFQITTNVVRDLDINDYIVLETGNSLDKVMSQQAVSKILKEIKTTIDNLPRESLITQELGNDSTKVISQKVVTDALALKADKLSLEEAISNKLSIVNLSPISNLEFIKDSTSNSAYRTECNLSEIFNNINYKNVIFEMFNPRLVDTTTSNVIILSTGKTFYFSFAKYLQGKYYYDTTVSNLDFYKEGASGVFKKYTSALITLVLDIQENILELYLEDANNFEKLEVEKDNYKIVVDPHFIYSQHGGNDRYNTPQMYLGPQLLSVGSPYSGEGAVLYAINENKGNAVETVYLSRNVDSVDKEGIKLSGGKIKFYYNIDDGEELPINVTGIADPTTEYDAINKRYVDTKLPTKISQLQNDLNYSKNSNIVTINDLTSENDNLMYDESNSSAYIAIYTNERVVITNPIDLNAIYILPINTMLGEKIVNHEIIFSTNDTVPEIGFVDDNLGIKWAKEPTFNPNKTYAVTIEGTNVNDEMKYFSMYAEFDTLNTEEV